MCAGDSNAGVAFEQSCPAVPESVGAIRASLVRFAKKAGASPRTVDAVALAASEAATNVVRHAYRDRNQAGRIEVIGELAASELVVTVRDAGDGPRARGDSAGLGLGLSIIAQAADRIDLLRSPTGGVEVRMYFALGTRG
jgi:serine/threonine-protein kinase RsbW